MDFAFAATTAFSGRALFLRQTGGVSSSPRLLRVRKQATRQPILLNAQDANVSASPGELSQAAPWASAILLVDHGSKRAAANEMLDDVRDMVSTRLGTGAIVHVAHMELAEPSVLEGFTKCIADGANHIVVVPFFLAPGRHCTTDIPEMVKQAAQSFPGCTFEVREHLGTHPALVDAVLDRAMNVSA